MTACFHSVNPAECLMAYSHFFLVKKLSLIIGRVTGSDTHFLPEVILIKL